MQTIKTRNPPCQRGKTPLSIKVTQGLCYESKNIKDLNAKLIHRTRQSSYR